MVLDHCQYKHDGSQTVSCFEITSDSALAVREQVVIAYEIVRSVAGWVFESCGRREMGLQLVKLCLYPTVGKVARLKDSF